MLEEDGGRVVLQREGLSTDLVACGWKLIARTPGRLFAISERYGGTLICTTVAAVEQSAREMMRYIEWREMKEQEIRDYPSHL